jgi:hypothetical protein
VFPGTFDDLPNVNVGLGPFGNLEAAGAGLFDPGLGQSFNIQDNYDHTNAVSTYRLTVSRGIGLPRRATGLRRTFADADAR